MKSIILTMIASLCLCVSAAAQPSSSQLIGKVTVGKKPVSGVKVIPSNGDPVFTNPDGTFVIKFHRKVGPGDPTTLTLSGNWVIISPFGGVTNTQRLDNKAEIPIHVQPKGSREATSPESMLAVAREIIKRKSNRIFDLSKVVKRVTTEKQVLKLQLDETNQFISTIQTQLIQWEVIQEFAGRVGFPIEKIEEAFVHWVNTHYEGYKEDDEAIQRSLRKDWNVSAKLAEASMDKKLRDVDSLRKEGERVEQEQNKGIRDAFKDMQVLADSYRELGEMRKLIGVYDKIDKQISQQRNFKEVFRSEWSSLRFYLALTKSSLARNGPPNERAKLANETLQHCNEGLTVYKQDTDPLQWGALQFLTADALFQLSQDQRGLEREQTTREAGRHLALALQVEKVEISNEQCPKTCLLTFRAVIGLLATVGGSLVEGDEGVRLMTEGSKSLERTLSALGNDSTTEQPMLELLIAGTHYALAQQATGKKAAVHLELARKHIEHLLAGPAKGLPRDSVEFARDLLGTILINLAQQSSGPASVEYTRLAISQFESLITACKPTAGNSCGSAEQGIEMSIGVLLSKGETTEATAAAIRFVSVLRKWLEILPSEPDNELRLRARTSLARTLIALGGLKSGKDGVSEVNEGIEVVEQALRQIPDKELSQRHSLQVVLLQAQFVLGRKLGFDNSVAKIDTIVATIDVLLRDPEQWEAKTLWIGAQLNLTVYLTNLATELESEEAKSKLELAVRHVNNALKTLTPGTNDWVSANLVLGHTYLAQALLLPQDQAIARTKEASQAFERSLTVIKLATSPSDWASTRADFIGTIFDLGMRLGAEQGEQKRQTARELQKETIASLDTNEYPMEWAHAQAGLGHLLFLSASLVEGQDRLQNLQEAAKAFELALTKLDSSNAPVSWARAEDEYGQVLVKTAELVTADQAELKQLAAVGAFEKALTIKPPAIAPLPRALTQARLGHALTDLAGFQGDAGYDQLIRAIEAFQEAIEVFQPGKEDWSAAQSELGYAHYMVARFGRDNQPENVAAAIEAYNKALPSLSNAGDQIALAFAKADLGDALSLAGWISTDSERIARWQEAVEVLTEAVAVLKPSGSTAVRWGRAQAQLGSVQFGFALIPGQDRNRNLNAALKSFQNAYSIFQADGFENERINALIGLGDTYFQLRQATESRKSYEAARTLDDKDDRALAGLAALNHDLIFDFVEALRLQRQLAELYPKNFDIQGSLAESYFTADAFLEADQLLTKLLERSDLSAQTRIPLQAFEIANAVARGRTAQIPEMLDGLIRITEEQPADFTLTWWFDGTTRYISRSKLLTAKRKWLLQLFAALKNANRDSMVAGLRRARADYNRSVK
jgi:tetratricopeptide (TPR) repeat protein